jgi:hypothetical protein
MWRCKKIYMISIQIDTHPLYNASTVESDIHKIAYISFSSIPLSTGIPHRTGFWGTIRLPAWWTSIQIFTLPTAEESRPFLRIFVLDVFSEIVGPVISETRGGFR